MPYPTGPKWALRLSKSLRLFYYSLTALAGVAALWFTPNTVSNKVSTLLTVLWGVLLIFGSLVALYGVLRVKFRFELASLPFIITGLMIYTVTIIDLMFDTITRLAQAASLSALLTLTALRLVDLLIVSYKLRKLHDEDEKSKGALR